MPKPDRVVYRSTHPDVLAHWEKTGSAEAQQAWRERVNQTLAELGFADRRFATTDGFETIEVTGVEHQDGEEIPVGWKTTKKLFGAIVPDKRRAAGKRAAERLATLTAPSPRRKLPGGMPGACFASAGFALMRPGLARHGDAVYVTWSDELEEPTADKIDPAVWERVKLSEYYAVLEREDADAEEDVMGPCMCGRPDCKADGNVAVEEVGADA